jgi:hypothetical protein
MRTSATIISLVFLLTFDSCNQHASEPEPTEIGSYKDVAFIIAKAMKDPAVQQLIKDEALLQFDFDHDVLIQPTLNKKVGPGVTFLDALKNSANEIDIEATLRLYPTLSLFVPTLDDFSAEKWGPVGSNPSIGYITSDEEVTAVDRFGVVQELSRVERPNFPVVLLKENERVGYTTDAVSDHEIAFSANGFNYYFLNTDKNQSTSGLTELLPFDEKVVSAFEKDCDGCMQRDFIYYGISPNDGVTEGEFDSQYAESITSISFFNKYTAQLFLEDWTEGGFEFYFNIPTPDAEEDPQVIQTIAYVPADGLADGQTYYFAKPVVITPWRMDIYGNSLKISVSEYDGGAGSMREMNFATTKGTNFKEGSNGLTKVGTGFGAQPTRGVGGALDIEWSDNTKVLGDAMLKWEAPAIISKDGGTTLDAYAQATGTLKFSVTPARIE